MYPPLGDFLSGASADYEQVLTAMGPPDQSRRGYSTSAWQDYDPYSDEDYEPMEDSNEPNFPVDSHESFWTQQVQVAGPIPVMSVRRALKF